ncbi:thiamine-phosphate kinase [Schlesneria paludicola]|uniref:thiamine-phosphate kinase n=1 Tax=Schlesneria paludicola TaxID=360056 RepID=UPI00029A8264|nr:thiamine-phosphate kinase [Schlesneria paludicola]
MSRPEFQLIDWIRSRVTDRPPVSLGIGDDAACLQPTGDRATLVAIDMLMEGTHFTFPPATPRLAGRKALAVNLSDIAAMAGRPTVAFVSVALPKTEGMSFAQEVHEGLLQLANEFDVVVAGGDTNSWTGPLVISVTVMGEPLGPVPVCRQGAKPGDWLFVTGALGGSLPSGRHLTFTPRVHEVRQLASLVEIHAMIDISDGLAADLHHILKASQVGAVLDASEIPLTDAVRNAHRRDEVSGAGSVQAQKSFDIENAKVPDFLTPAPLFRGLSDGEDFELLFSVSPEDGRKLLRDWQCQTAVTKIGEICRGDQCQLKFADGTIQPLPPIGWTHPLNQ